MQTRTRLLLALIGVSIMFLIDLGVNGSSVIKTFTDRTVQVTPVDFKGWHITEDTPFLRKEGRQTQGGEGLKAIRVVGGGDIEVRRSTTGEVVLYYDVRTYGLSRRHAEPFHELVDVTSTRRGDTLHVALHMPEEPREVRGVRVSYRLEVPEDVPLWIDNEFGDVDIHGMKSDVVVRVQGGSVRVGEHEGALDLTVAKGSLWLSYVKGNVNVDHEYGRVEAVRIDGALHFQGERSTLTVDRTTGNVDVHISEGVTGFYSVEGALNVRADRARVRVADARGEVDVHGTFSPIDVDGGRKKLTVMSDRGHVVVRLSSRRPWDLDLNAKNGKVHTAGAFSKTDGVEEASIPVVVHVSGAHVTVEAREER